jgi:hypothetical protein
MPKNLVVEHKSRNLLRRVSSAADAGQALDIVAESGAPLEVPISHVPPPNEPTDMIGRPTNRRLLFFSGGERWYLSPTNVSCVYGFTVHILYIYEQIRFIKKSEKITHVLSILLHLFIKF